MSLTPREAVRGLLEIEHAKTAALRHSLDNGTLLLVWGSVYLLDLMGFDVGRLAQPALNSFLPSPTSHLGPGGMPLALTYGIAWMAVLNLATLAWRAWYTRYQPIRLRNALTTRVLCVWSGYMVLLGLGISIPVMVGVPCPPGWFTLLGLLGALPLWAAGYQQRRQWVGASRLVNGEL